MNRFALALAALLPLAAHAIDLTREWPITVSDMEGETAFSGDRVTVPKPANPRVPASRVAARRADDGTLTLQFSNAWIAQMKWQGGPKLDLRPYLAQGTVEFDLNVIDLAKGGLKFKLGCGKDCERKLPFLFAAREMVGKGKQHLSFSLKCFWREGDDLSAVPMPFAIESTGNGELQISKLRINKTGKATTACPDYRTIAVTPEPLQ
ncbi:MAG: hypothetical protein EOP39_14460, partial [Rubrivivax sp.]